jgi:uncharacterized membrane protein YkvA (DUF1232 family)
MKVSGIFGFLGKSLGFAKALSLDPRIPARDKAVLAGMLALLVSPFDIIPDFIPVLGQLDDVMILILLMDYICNRVPEEVIRSHFPWDAAKLLAWRKRLGFLTGLVPHWAKQKIWRAGEMPEGAAKETGTGGAEAGAEKA